MTYRQILYNEAQSFVLNNVISLTFDNVGRNLPMLNVIGNRNNPFSSERENLANFRRFMVQQPRIRDDRYVFSNVINNAIQRYRDQYNLNNLY